MIKDSREGKAAVYDSYALYNLNVVAVIPSMGKDAKKENGRQWRDSGKKKESGFDFILKTEEKKSADNDINIRTSGYTKNATATRTNIHMHEYVG